MLADFLFVYTFGMPWQVHAFKQGCHSQRKKIWKMKKIGGLEKVREFHFQSGKFRKNERSQGKSGNFKIFQKVAS